MPPDETTTSIADGKPRRSVGPRNMKMIPETIPAISEPKRRRRSMGERSVSKTERELTGVSIENLGTLPLHKINQNKLAAGVRCATTTRRRTVEPRNMKTIPETSERECTGTSSEVLGTKLLPNKLADGVKTIARRRSVGNLNTVLEKNEPNVVPIRFYGADREPEHHIHKIKLVLTKLQLKPRTAKPEQEPGRANLDAELEAFIHNFPNGDLEKTQLDRNKQRRRPSLLIAQDSKAASEQFFEIDYIAGERKVGTRVEYLVKWSKYPPKEASWVFQGGVHAPKILDLVSLKNDAYRVIKRQLREDQKHFTPFLLDKYDAKSRKRWELLEAEFNWNTIIDGKAATIYIENWADKGHSLPKFEYIFENRHSKEVEEALRKIGPNDLEKDLGCEEGCECKNAKYCCAEYHDGLNYDCRTNSKGNRTIRLSKPSMLVVECGEHCKCDPTTCRQRVLEKGRKIPLVLFWEGAKGWGLRTIQKIPKNTFVGEYVGEVISFAEAESPNRNTTYQFELWTELPTLSNTRLVIDATNFGNEMKFINHSCNPNLQFKYVITNKYSSYDSRIGFYSTRNIEPGEELTFDYYQGTAKTKKRGNADINCRCGEKGCRGWMPTGN